MNIYRAQETRHSQRQLAQWKARLMRSVGLLALTLVVCMVGLFLLDPASDPLPGKAFRALWNAVNLLSTLGAFTDFNNAQRAFLIVTMMGFVFAGGYGMSSLYGLFSGNTYMLNRENKLMKSELLKLVNHVVVIGYGGLGQAVAKALRVNGTPVLILEQREELVLKASEHDYLVIQNDVGVDETTMAGHARLKHARGVVITVDDADRALALTLLAHSYNPELAITTVATSESRAGLLRRAGASAVIRADTLVASALIDGMLATPEKAPPAAAASSGEPAR